MSTLAVKYDGYADISICNRVVRSLIPLHVVEAESSIKIFVAVSIPSAIFLRGRPLGCMQPNSFSLKDQAIANDFPREDDEDARTEAPQLEETSTTEAGSDSHRSQKMTRAVYEYTLPDNMSTFEHSGMGNVCIMGSTSPSFKIIMYGKGDCIITGGKQMMPTVSIIHRGEGGIFVAANVAHLDVDMACTKRTAMVKVTKVVSKVTCLILSGTLYVAEHPTCHWDLLYDNDPVIYRRTCTPKTAGGTSGDRGSSSSSSRAGGKTDGPPKKRAKK